MLIISLRCRRELRQYCRLHATVEFCRPPAAQFGMRNVALLDPTARQRIIALGAMVGPPKTPEQFAELIAENIEKWKKVIKFAGIKPI